MAGQYSGTAMSCSAASVHAARAPPPSIPSAGMRGAMRQRDSGSTCFLSRQTHGLGKFLAIDEFRVRLSRRFIVYCHLSSGAHRFYLKGRMRVAASPVARRPARSPMGASRAKCARSMSAPKNKLKQESQPPPPLLPLPPETPPAPWTPDPSLHKQVESPSKEGCVLTHRRGFGKLKGACCRLLR